MTRSDAEREDVAGQVAGRADDLALALTELSGVLLADEGLEATLHRVADLAVRVVPDCHVAGVTLLANGRPETAACTDELVLEVDRRQYAVGDGPCLDSLRRKQINSVDAAEAGRRWPMFAAEAGELGLWSFLAAPLLVADEAIGALNLYSRSRQGFLSLDDALIAMFSGQASVALANARLYRSAVQLSGQLQQAMESRAVIEQAKGVLMALHRVPPDTAFTLLKDRSQAENRKLRDVAIAVVDGVL